MRSNTSKPRMRLLAVTAALSLLPAVVTVAQPFEPDPSAVPQEPPAKYGAIAFTADGSYSATWKRASKADAEATVLARCGKFRRGVCKVVGFRQELCAALASFRTAKDLKVTYAGGGVTQADAQRAALERCNRDARARRQCQSRTVICGDGRAQR